MSAFPYMRMFIGDYLGDTRHLTTAEHGAYLLLIFTYWQRGKPLPDDDVALAHIAGMGKKQWGSTRPKLAEFFDVKDGFWVHRRIEREITHMLTKSLKAKGAGLTSAQRRSNGRSTKPYTSTKKEEVTDKSVTSAGEAPACVPEGLGEGQEAEPDPGEMGEGYTSFFEAFWHEYPNKTGKRAASLAYQKAFERLGGQKGGQLRIHGKLLTAARHFAALSKATDPRYIPHGATWLNQARYDDDAIKARINAPEPREQVFDEVLPPAPKPRNRNCPECGVRTGFLHEDGCSRRRPEADDDGG